MGFNSGFKGLIEVVHRHYIGRNMTWYVTIPHTGCFVCFCQRWFVFTANKWTFSASCQEIEQLIMRDLRCSGILRRV